MEQGCLHGIWWIWVSRFLVAPIAGLADGPVGWGSRKGRDIRVKKGYGWWGASIDDFKRGKSTWAGCVSGLI